MQAEETDHHGGGKMWQSLMVGRKTITPGMRCVVGNVKQINIHEDRWLPVSRIGGPANQHDPQKAEDLFVLR